jgi:hypothetical protein
VSWDRPVLVAELEYALERGDALLAEAPRPRVVEDGGRVEHCSLGKVEDLVHVQKALGAALYTRLHFLSRRRSERETKRAEGKRESPLRS